MMVNGANISDIDYSIVDMTGKTVQEGKATFSNNTITVPLNSTHVAGNYILYVTDKKHGFEAKEDFQITK